MSELALEKSYHEVKYSFLSNLQGKKGYKRCVSSPLRYGGGKSLAVGYIVELLPDNVNKVISPFFGGGSVEVALAKYLDIEVVGYDIFDILVNYWQIQIKQPQNLYEELIKWDNSKEFYYEKKEVLKKHWNNEINLSNFDLATHYYFNHNLSYGPGFLGWMSSNYLDRKKYMSMLNKVKEFEVHNNLEVKCNIFDNVIPEHNKDFMYLDPPYFLEGDSKMFKGIYPQRNFPIHHNGFDHYLLANLLKRHKGGFILSYNDCSKIRELYKDFEIIDISWQYTMGQGETRIGKNRISNKQDHIKKSHEILIRG